jgi:predicted nucleic acid-binding protein
MNGVLVDSNIIIDILTEDPQWFRWSSQKLEELANRHILLINKIIYAEVSVSFNQIEELEMALPSYLFQRALIPWEAAFLAGKAFLKYRREGGNRISPLPDFLIGAHAAVEKLTLLTSDDKRFKHHYPKLTIIAPCKI